MILLRRERLFHTDLPVIRVDFGRLRQVEP